MNDFESNWKNSEVITLFAESYFDNMAEEIVATVPALPVASIVEPLEQAVILPEPTDNLLVAAEMDRENIANELRVVANKASEDGNHRAAFLIETTIESLYQ